MRVTSRSTNLMGVASEDAGHCFVAVSRAVAVLNGVAVSSRTSMKLATQALGLS